MTLRHYEVGQIVFSEGEESKFVGYIAEGEAEVSKRHDDRDIVIGYLKAGEFFGEMAAIEGAAHAATVRATGSLTVECCDKTEFLRNASQDSDLAFHLLERLSRRLHTLDDAYAAAVSTNRKISASLNEQTPDPTVHEKDVSPAATLYPGSDRVTTYIPADGLVLDHFPFIVGRTPSMHETIPADRVDLRLNDPAPYRLSRLHLEFVKHDGRVQVRDLNSHLGTKVNGTFIGRFFSRDTVDLTVGENIVVAGGKGSPYVFRVVVEK